MWPCRAGNSRAEAGHSTSPTCPGRWWGELAEKGQRGDCMGDELGVHCLSFSPHPLYAVHLGSPVPSLSTSPASQYSGKRVCMYHLHHPSCWALRSSAAHTAAHFLKGKACPLPRSEDSYVPAPSDQLPLGPFLPCLQPTGRVYRLPALSSPSRGSSLAPRDALVPPPLCAPTSFYLPPATAPGQHCQTTSLGSQPQLP